MSEMDLDTLAAHANSYASANGIMVVSKTKTETNGPSSTATSAAAVPGKFECAPMSLLPNAYPRDRFQQAHDVAPYFNELVDRVSRDSQFLIDTLGGGVSTMDPYTAKILEMYKQVYVDGPVDSPANQADRLGIHRSDYMLHKSDDDKEYELKQVELNTIAASFAGLSCRIAELHKYLTSRFKHEVKDFLETNEKAVVVGKGGVGEEKIHAFGVPENPALQQIPIAMKFAVDRYVDRYDPKHRLVVLFVVQEGETNMVDQRLLEFALWEHHGIPVVRLSLAQANEQITVSDTGALLLKQGSSSEIDEIAVVYYRAGYAPTDYPDGDDGVEWTARLKLEQSRAAKCPSLGYHLAGTKKVQQELARPGVLERFFPNDTKKVTAMRTCFAGLYSMGDDATAEDVQAAQAVLNGQDALYVLKPQREGGGYNFYGKDLANKLRENTSFDDSTKSLKLGATLAEYILMQRLFPPKQRAILLRGGKVEGSGDSVSELGCFGCIVSTLDGDILHNKYAGFLLRTKFSGVDEGGVASGFATLSSPYLC
jgi:glutathione synthase